jgi:hypothetical protein
MYIEKDTRAREMKEDEKDRVADPHHFNADQDPTFHIDEDFAPHQSTVV